MCSLSIAAQGSVRCKTKTTACRYRELVRLSFHVNISKADSCSTTTTLIREYLPKNTLAKKVDYNFFIDARANISPTSKSPAEAVANVRKVMPCQVINHTAYRPFRDRPIVVTVETKKRYGSQEGAKLQTGTWHTAHWEFLSRRIEKTGDTFEGLPFLPGILIQGHDWSFVATTREESKTVVWLEQRFGVSEMGG